MPLSNSQSNIPPAKNAKRVDWEPPSLLPRNKVSASMNEKGQDWPSAPKLLIPSLNPQPGAKAILTGTPSHNAGHYMTKQALLLPERRYLRAVPLYN